MDFQPIALKRPYVIGDIDRLITVPEALTVTGTQASTFSIVGGDQEKMNGR